MSKPSKMLLTTLGLALLFNVSHRTVENWRYRKVGPVPLNFPNGLVRYDEEEALKLPKQYPHKKIGQVWSWPK